MLMEFRNHRSSFVGLGRPSPRGLDAQIVPYRCLSSAHLSCTEIGHTNHMLMHLQCRGFTNGEGETYFNRVSITSKML